MKDKACIVGVGATGFCRGEGSGKSLHGLQLEAALAALADAGLRAGQVDGIMPFPNLGTAEGFAASLGCENLRFATTVNMGGAAPVASLGVAAAAVSSGLADYVLMPAGWNGYSGPRAGAIVQEMTASIPGGAIATSICRTDWWPLRSGTRLSPVATCTSTAPRPSSWARSHWPCASTRSSTRPPSCTISR